MTKLTIQHEWKSYTSLDEKCGSHIEFAVSKWIDFGYLVELQPQEEKQDEHPLIEDDTLEAIKDFEEYENSVQEQSIISKLRAELERRMALYEKNESVYNAPYYAECLAIYDLINKLKKESSPDISNEFAKEAWRDFENIEKVPEFDYKEICGKYSGQKFPEAKAIIEYWEHIERLTTTLNKLIERLNNK